MIFNSVVPQIVGESVRRAFDEADKKRTSTYDKLEDYFRGDTKSYLVRNEGEVNESWATRNAMFTDCGLTCRLANALIATLYGKPIDRYIEGQQKQVELFDMIYEANHIGALQRMLGQSQIVAGDGWASVRWSDEIEEEMPDDERWRALKIHAVDPGNIFVELHPEDPMRAITVVERLVDPNAKDKPKFWVFTADRYTLIDSDGAPLLKEETDSNGWRENPYEEIPYIHWRGMPIIGEFYGSSPMRGVVELHEYYNNRESQLDKTIRMQAYSLLTISDDSPDQTIKFSADNALLLTKGGVAQYLSSGAQISEVRQSLDDIWRRAFEIGGIPLSMVRGGQANSGYQLILEHRTMAEIIHDLRVEAEEAERELARIVCVVGYVHGLSLPEDPVVSVDFNLEVVPVNKDMEHDRDYKALTGIPQTMLLEDYLRKWRPDIPEESIPEYIAKLQAEQSERALMSAALGLQAASPLPEIPEGSVL